MNDANSLTMKLKTQFLQWSEAFNADANTVGGKAWNLGRLDYYGFDIPRGGVIPVSAYQQFLFENKLIDIISELSARISLDTIRDTETEKALQFLREKISAGILSPSLLHEIQTNLETLEIMDRPLAVRSSATSEDSRNTSFAGIHESILNVNGMAALAVAIKHCFASVWTTRALAYRRKMNIPDSDVLLAVIVMELIEADASGVAFSCDPSNGREDVMLVSANHGLGESVVDGVTDPDTYLLDRFSFRTIDTNVGRKQKVTVLNPTGGTRTIESNNAKQVLTAAQQAHLGLLVRRIFDTLGEGEHHQDIEWVLRDDAFLIVQARPVTAMPRYTLTKFSRYADVWSNANFRDAVPMVQCELMRNFTQRFVDRMMLKPFEEINYPIPPGLLLSKYVDGRMYLNAGLYQFLLHDALGINPDDVNRIMGGHQVAIHVNEQSPYRGVEGLRRLKAMMKNSRLTLKYGRKKSKVFQHVDSYRDRIANAHIETISDAELLRLLNNDEHEFNKLGDAYMFLSSGAGTLAVAVMLLKKSFGQEAEGIVSALAAGQGDVISAAQGYRLFELATIAKSDADAMAYFSKPEIISRDWKCLPESSPFRKAFEHFLKDFGHRAVYEMDITQPRWSEDPSYLLNNIKIMIAAGDQAKFRQRQSDARAYAQTLLRERVGFFKRAIINTLVKQGVTGSETREQAKSYTVHLCGIHRLLCLEVGRRFVEWKLLKSKDDIFDCSFAEITAVLNASWNGEALQRIVSERRERHHQRELLPALDVITDSRVSIETESVSASKDTLTGIAVSAGVANGRACIVHQPDRASHLQPGDIMVAPSTDPSWTPIFINVSGIVLETGGYTSHGSIVAREYGIPAVVNVRNALKAIDDSMTVQVNGMKGTVHLIRNRSTIEHDAITSP